MATTALAISTKLGTSPSRQSIETIDTMSPERIAIDSPREPAPVLFKGAPGDLK
jgi:hypothetical protein